MAITKLLLLFIALVIRECSCFFDILDNLNPDLKDDGFLDSATIARRYGYRCEEHFVTTSDGYILKMLRLNGRINGSVVSPSAPTVFILHGIDGADIDFIIDGPNDNGGILSDYGFDVWLGNHRGNRYSKNHTTLKTNSREFWNFNYNEMSLIDTSAFVDYILEEVNKTALHIIGNSQGGFMLAMFLAYKPEYNEKVKSFTFLASALYPGSLRSPILSFLVDIGEVISRNEILLANPFELSAYSKEGTQLMYRLCNRKSPFFNLCLAARAEVFGKDRNNTDLDRIPYYAAQGSNSVSSNQILHITQFFTYNRLELFDYGPQRNILKYGQSTPPRANFSLITPPKLFLYGTEDRLIPKEFVLASKKLTINVEKIVRVDSYNHFNFMHAVSLKDKVTSVIKDFILSHD